MSIKDVIKKSVYESFLSGEMTPSRIVVIGVVSCLLGIYIFIIYKSFSRRSFYSKDTNITIAGTCVIVSAIMIAMQSNLIVSLGMVGALSIVRFRTAIKNPLDLLFLFWSISAGIICGVRLYLLAIALCATMTILIYTLNRIPTMKSPMILVVRLNDIHSAGKVSTVLKEGCSYVHMSTTNTNGIDIEQIYEIKTKDKAQIVSSINELDGVVYVNCMQSDGEAWY